ncbi:M16 family metallopeptidase [Nannocystis sp. SCPEA4]|uniref:M16 family metallopeptidase n=1 Tax=Nannocystis sp. SCPEA4 TaxID=2996787 RepID=UPI0022721DBD|nr:M16 family metallopeptidase [Nannocystis sp. SCPEA4]MCY1062416.1 insulinase family protein [Nannocystis sp. SCPEA4]
MSTTVSRLFGAFVLSAVACKTAANAPSTPPAAAIATPPAGDRDAILTASDLPPTHAALPDDPLAVSVHRLSNGITVYISTDRQKPRFDAWIAVRAGSRHDPAASTGLAHYLEHMLFKGTDELGTLDHAAEAPHLARIEELYRELRATQDPEQRRKIFAELDLANQKVAVSAIPNEFDRVYAELGIAGLNAFTSFDQTVYVADVPSNRIDAWADVEGERFSDPVFRLFFTEMEAVYEEKNLSLDNPWVRTFYATTKNLFPRHPYGTQTTIGEIEHLKVPAYRDMVDYFNRWYVPNNMAVVLAGDIDAATALPRLEAALGKLEPKPLEAPQPGSLAPIGARVQTEVVAEGEQEVMLAWQTASAADADEPALTVMDWLMDNSTSGLLNVELELSQKVPSASSSTLSLRESGWFSVRAQLRDGQTHAEVEALLLAVVEKLKRGEFTPADVAAIVLNQEIGDKRARESNDFRAHKMTDAFITHRPWADVVARDRKIRAVTREDVIRVANKYLGANYSAVHRRAGKPEVAKIDKPSMTPVELHPERRSPFADALLKRPAQQLEPEWLIEGTHYKRGELAGGPLVAVSNGRNDLFSLTYRFERGHKRDRLLCHALDVVEQSGAGELTAEALKKQLFALGTSVSFSCDAQQSEITVEGVDATMEQSLALVERWLREVKIDKAVLRGIADNVISTRRDAMEDPDELAGALADYAIHGKDSEYLHAPTNAQIAAAKPEALTKLAREFLDYQHKTFYFGPRSASDAAKVIGLGKGHRKLPLRSPVVYRKVPKPTLYFTHRDVAKSTIAVALPSAALTREQRPAARLLSEYLGGGMNTLLFQEMRESRGLVYYAWGVLLAGPRPSDAWALRGGLGTQSDKTSEALKVFFELLGRPLDAVRLGSTRAAIEQEYRSSRVDPRASGMLVHAWDELGEKTDPRPWVWQTIGGMTQEQLQGFASGFAAVPPIVGLVGNRERVDLEALKKIADVVEVAPSALFSYGSFPKGQATAAAAR